MASDSPARSPGEDERRLGEQLERLRWVAVHCTGRALRERLEVEDLVQEALLRAWTDRERWPARAPGDNELARWLATLVRRAAIDAARASRARKRAGRPLRLDASDFSRGGARASDLAAVTAGPATRASAKESQLELERAFQALSGEHRRVIALRQFHGLSAAEAGARLGKTETAVHSLYRRALEAWEHGAAGKAGSRDESRRGPRSGGT